MPYQTATQLVIRPHCDCDLVCQLSPAAHAKRYVQLCLRKLGSQQVVVEDCLGKHTWDSLRRDRMEYRTAQESRPGKSEVSAGQSAGQHRNANERVRRPDLLCSISRRQSEWIVCPQGSTAVGLTLSKRYSKHTGQFWRMLFSTQTWLFCTRDTIIVSCRHVTSSHLVASTIARTSRADQSPI